jgi:aconitate hydratase
MKLGKDSLNTRAQLQIDDKTYHYFSLERLIEQGHTTVTRLPYSHKILLENLLRFEDGHSVLIDDIKALIDSTRPNRAEHEIAYRPSRVLMQDFTGVPAVVDLAAMRDAVDKLGKDPALINPLSPVDLVIDHSVMVDKFASESAYRDNVAIEMERNGERYQFLRWGQSAFDNFRVVPPGTGICHQVNLEYLAKVVWSTEVDGNTYAFPDTLVGTDSHTTMINGLGVLGWGVGGIEAEAAMLGQPVSMLIPDVVGFKLTGSLREGVTATDLVLTVVEMLRKHGVVGKFVEFFGAGLNDLPLADRATIGNMAPEYGATCGFFPVDQETLNYLTLSGRDPHAIKLVETYAKAQGMWRDDTRTAAYSSTLQLDLATVVPSLAGPKRPQDRVALSRLREATETALQSTGDKTVPVAGAGYSLSSGDVVIAAITSCTNTSNPAVMLAAGLVAKKAVEKGLTRKPWVKTSLAPGSKVVTEYLEKAGYQRYLNALGFNLVGYGCTTCIGNSGPLPEAIEHAVDEGDLTVCSVLSGNRNFEGRIHQKVRANWLASPPLVVVFALVGTTKINLDKEPVGENDRGEKIYLKDIWPSNQEISDAIATVNSGMFTRQYADVFTGDDTWQSMTAKHSKTYPWNSHSTYIQHPPFFVDEIQGGHKPLEDVSGARILALLGDSITTDHISPAGAIAENSPAGRYLMENGVAKRDFNSYGSRRGNHEVMMRGTFANVRIRNEMLTGVEGGYTRYIPTKEEHTKEEHINKEPSKKELNEKGPSHGLPTGEQLSIYDAAMAYQKDNTPLVVIAGKEYGTGSSRDWAAKGTRLLGIRAVIAESFERIHRSNLIGMGVLPLQFPHGASRITLGLTGEEVVGINGVGDLKPGGSVTIEIHRPDGTTESCDLRSRIDTADEFSYYKAGGILQYVLQQLIAGK